MDDDAYPHAEIGLRLKASRLTLEPDLDQKGFAAKHGFSTTQYTNWESGHRRIPVPDAAKFEARYGLTLDFIYLGRLQTLPHNLANALSDSPLLKK